MIATGVSTTRSRRSDYLTSQQGRCRLLVKGRAVESRGALFAVAIPLIAFKIWFAILLLMYAPTRDTMVWIAATHWPFVFIIAVLAVAAVPLYRLLKVRAKRERLRRAEFMLEPPRAQCSALWDTVSRLEGGDGSGRVAR
jgi:hypothetical protein